MVKLSTEIIKKAVYNLCFEANTCLEPEVYSKIYSAYENADSSEIKNTLISILQNAKIANAAKRPLCQDTGQAVIFIELGQDVLLEGAFIEDAVNTAVKDCYTENYFRKSVVKNAVFDRSNTNSNTPAVIHIKYVKGDEVKIGVLIKGAGSENKSKLEMLLPTIEEDELAKKCAEMILSAAQNACPPMFVGIGIGGTADKACIMSKEVFLIDYFTQNELRLSEKIKKYTELQAPEQCKGAYVIDVKVKTTATHIACMPVSVCINCHSKRVSSCVIKDGHVLYNHQIPDFIDIKEEIENYKEVFISNTDEIRNLQIGEKVLLTGEIYVARDMAHKRMNELLKNGEELPFELRNNIIFYAGPCPNKPEEIIGSVGPTTASRMDGYAVDFYNRGLLGTIGKGGRSLEVKDAILKNRAKYFTVTGGIAALLAEKVKKCELIAFEDLGAEAVYKLYIEKFPVKVEIG